MINFLCCFHELTCGQTIHNNYEGQHKDIPFMYNNVLNFLQAMLTAQKKLLKTFIKSLEWKTRDKKAKTSEIEMASLRGPVDRRPSNDEAPQMGKIDPFIKRALTFEPLMQF